MSAPWVPRNLMTWQQTWQQREVGTLLLDPKCFPAGATATSSFMTYLHVTIVCSSTQRGQALLVGLLFVCPVADQKSDDLPSKKSGQMSLEL